MDTTYYIFITIILMAMSCLVGFTHGSEDDPIALVMSWALWIAGILSVIVGITLKTINWNG